MLKVYDIVDTTMDICRKHLNQNLEILAMTQTNGVGKQNRTWHSPRGNFYYSFIINTPQHAQHLALIYSVITAHTIQHFRNIKLKYKYPNDIYFHNRKLAGILVENYDNRTVIGIGVNLKTSPQEFISLKDIGMLVQPLEFYNAFKFIETYFSHLSVNHILQILQDNIV